MNCVKLVEEMTNTNPCTLNLVQVMTHIVQVNVKTVF